MRKVHGSGNKSRNFDLQSQHFTGLAIQADNRSASHTENLQVE